MRSERFFSVSHNSFATKGYPWISEIVMGQVERPCSTCPNLQFYPARDISVLLEPRTGKTWPDVLGSGDGLLFIVSEKVIEAWANELGGDFPVFQVHIVNPLPKALETIEKPRYFWVDGSRLRGARLDFRQSGFVDWKICSGCGRLSYNVSATYDLQVTQKAPYVFVPETWNGNHLFTTDLSDLSFFCSERILDIAKAYDLSNFSFIPIEEGSGIGAKGISYRKRPRKGK